MARSRCRPRSTSPMEIDTGPPARDHQKPEICPAECPLDRVGPLGKMSAFLWHGKPGEILRIGQPHPTAQDGTENRSGREVERETGFEPATFCLGSRHSAS